MVDIGRGKIIKLKEVVDDAIKDLNFVEHIVVLRENKK